MFACVIAPGVAASGCADRFSPRVEAIDADTVIVEIGGTERLHGSPQEIAVALQKAAHPDARVAVAPSRDVALYAARGFESITVIRPGEEAAKLGELPVETLAPDPDLLATFDCWGVRSLRDLARLPDVGVAERLGAEGIRLQKLARGEPLDLFRPVSPDEIYESVLELEHPIDTLEPLSFVMNRLLQELCDRLESRALAALELRLTLLLEDKSEHARRLRLPVPMRNPKTFLKLLQLDLTAHPPNRGVMGVRMRMEPEKPRLAQEGLFAPPEPEPERLELTLARIAGLVGEQNVGSAELIDTHRPGAFRMVRALPRDKKTLREKSPMLAFRVSRPPLPAQVQMVDGQPVTLAARNIRGKVVSSAGPWRTSGDWWRDDAWGRDDWDIALSDGALYRIYSEHATGRWFVDGRYD